jgi:hypothetical protein
MSRAALLPTLGDPVLLNFWFRFYKNFQDEIDTLYVRVASPLSEDILDYLTPEVRDLDFKILRWPTRAQHGDNINAILEECTEDHIILMEDDVFVLQPNRIGPLFQRIEDDEVDCIGSTRGCCSPELIAAITDEFGLSDMPASPEHPLNQCPNLWPSVFLSKAETLKATTRDFNAARWAPGESIEGLRWVSDKEECGDTFVRTSIELRAAGCRIDYVHQNHAGPVDIQQSKTEVGLFGPPPPWVHFGSLSTFMTPFLNSWGTDEEPALPPIPQAAADEYMRRVGLFLVIAEHGMSDDPAMKKFNAGYNEYIERFASIDKLSRDRIQEYADIYTRLLKVGLSD